MSNEAIYAAIADILKEERSRVDARIEALDSDALFKSLTVAMIDLNLRALTAVCDDFELRKAVLIDAPEDEAIVPAIVRGLIR